MLNLELLGSFMVKYGADITMKEIYELIRIEREEKFNV